MECRKACGACCIAPSIQQPFYGMPGGKPAGVRCVHLAEDLRCRLFGDARRPAVCAAFAAEEEICGTDRDEALAKLQWLEIASEPW
jgi:Fe-S-cluster containining protein